MAETRVIPSGEVYRQIFDAQVSDRMFAIFVATFRCITKQLTSSAVHLISPNVTGDKVYKV